MLFGSVYRLDAFVRSNIFFSYITYKIFATPFTPNPTHGVSTTLYIYSYTIHHIPSVCINITLLLGPTSLLCLVPFCD